MDVGDIYLADLRDEQRRRVVVVSTGRFSALSGRAVVVPEVGGPQDEVPDPWRIEVDGTVYAVDHVRSVPVARLLDRIGRAPASAVNDLRRALRSIA